MNQQKGFLENWQAEPNTENCMPIENQNFLKYLFLFMVFHLDPLPTHFFSKNDCY